jgi:hypothetical protein
MSRTSLRQRDRTGTANRRSRISLALLLFAGALLWPLLNLGIRGSTLVAVTHEHGIDTTDLLALIPLALAVALFPWRSRERRRRPQET